jgi:hypothetical protein
MLKGIQVARLAQTIRLALSASILLNSPAVFGQELAVVKLSGSETEESGLLWLNNAKRAEHRFLALRFWDVLWSSKPEEARIEATVEFRKHSVGTKKKLQLLLELFGDNRTPRQRELYLGNTKLTSVGFHSRTGSCGEKNICVTEAYTTSLSAKEIQKASASGLVIRAGEFAIDLRSSQAKASLARLLSESPSLGRDEDTPSLPLAGWHCVETRNRFIGEDRSSGCYRTVEECEDMRGRWAELDGNETSACYPSRRAACFSYWSNLQKVTIDSCSAALSDCSRQRKYIQRQKEDYSKVSKCKGVD